jgi:hypothetical protein
MFCDRMSTTVVIRQLGNAVLVSPYYPLGAIGTVPMAYDIFRAYEKMEGRTNTNKSIKIGKFNTKF